MTWLKVYLGGMEKSLRMSVLLIIMNKELGIYAVSEQMIVVSKSIIEQ